jgi:hypothetical protein
MKTLNQVIIVAKRGFTLHALMLQVSMLKGMIIALGSITLVSCSSTPPITSPEQLVFPSSNVSFSRHVQPFMNLTCNYAGCHNSRSMAGGIALESYFDVVFTTPGLVVARNPSQSRLIQVIDLNARIRPNHPNSFQTRITQNHIAGMKIWIQEGAQ